MVLVMGLIIFVQTCWYMALKNTASKRAFAYWLCSVFLIGSICINDGYLWQFSTSLPNSLSLSGLQIMAFVDIVYCFYNISRALPSSLHIRKG